jgi:trehalose-6-phosphatase
MRKYDSDRFCTILIVFLALFVSNMMPFERFWIARKNGTYVHARSCKSHICKTKNKDLQQEKAIGERWPL